MVLGVGWADCPPPDPDEPPEPLEPLPSFGHGWPLWPCRWVPPFGVVVEPPEDGSVVDGAALADGSGLAAKTIATPPVTSSAAAMPAVRIARRNPFGFAATVWW